MNQPKIYENISLKPYNGYSVDVKARYLVKPQNTEDLQVILDKQNFGNFKKFVLGFGFNTLFAHDIPYVVILNNIRGIQVIKQTSKHIYVKIGSGEDWIKLVKTAVKHGWGGIENMTMIYSTVGGAVAQNIAAYGQQISDTVESIEAVDLNTGEVKIFKPKDVGYKYRDSKFVHEWKDKYFITYVTFKLNLNADIDLSYWSQKHGKLQEEIKKFAQMPFTIKDVERTIRLMRLIKFGDSIKGSYGSCGSHFKNPIITKEHYLEILKDFPKLQYYPVEGMKYPPNDIDKVPSGAKVKIAIGHLLDEGLGLKNYWKGHVGTAWNHALIVLTDRKASANEVLDFTNMMAEKVKNMFDINLEREVKVIY